MKRIIPSLIALMLGIPCKATEATFSADGKTIYLTSLFKENAMHVIDIAAKKHRTVTPVPMVAEERIIALATDSDGKILIATSLALHIWDPATAKSRKILDHPKKFAASDLSCITAKDHPLKGAVLLLGESEDMSGKLLALLPGKKTWREVFCRRNDPFTAPRCNATGRMFLGSNSDLWEGNIHLEADEADDAGIIGSLSGCRIAPLAMMNTDSANSGAMVVRGVAPAGRTVYSLLGGRHMGAILETTAPARSLYEKEEGSHPELAEQFDIMKQSLAHTRIVHEGGPCDALCVHQPSAETHTVFWRQNLEEERGWYILRQGEKPQLLGEEPQE